MLTFKASQILKQALNPKNGHSHADGKPASSGASTGTIPGMPAAPIAAAAATSEAKD